MDSGASSGGTTGRYKYGFSEENWEEEMEKVPLFMTKSPETIDPDESPALAAMQALKYDSSDDEKTAVALKEDGNEFFRRKLYAKAVDAYTAALRMKNGRDDVELQAILYANRAAANFHLQNYGSSLYDAQEALKHKPDHVKAIARAAQASFRLNRYREAIEWCDKGLRVDPAHSVLIELSAKAEGNRKRDDKERRVRAAREKQRQRAVETLHQEIKKRGIQLKVSANKQTDNDDDDNENSADEPNPEHMPRIDSEGSMHWRVQFLYPEYQQSDCIENFHEDSRFADHLEVMFPGAPWDIQKTYKPELIRIYFYGKEMQSLVGVSSDKTLKTVLSDARYEVQDYVPEFLLISESSPYMKHFLKENTISRQDPT